MAYDLSSRRAPADNPKARVADNKEHAGAHQTGHDSHQIAVLEANHGDADNQCQIEPGALRIWPPQRIGDEAVAQIEDETADKGNRHQTRQVKMRDADD